MAFGEVHVGLYGVASASRSWHDITHIYNKLEISRKETLSDTATLLIFKGIPKAMKRQINEYSYPNNVDLTV